VAPVGFKLTGIRNVTYNQPLAWVARKGLEGRRSEAVANPSL